MKNFHKGLLFSSHCEVQQNGNCSLGFGTTGADVVVNEVEVFLADIDLVLEEELVDLDEVAALVGLDAANIGEGGRHGGAGG